ncbi:MAG: hypothetical protein H6822_00550 [Planctomycetaceae bacterium]|nr:hypothetical protein [Planctomycetales bacterium]MCB9920634.1 hypothetical protein [Planctomycetaceae bacterium]
MKDAVRAWKHRQAEVFVPLSHRPGETQADFGEVTVVFNGKTTKAAFSAPIVNLRHTGFNGAA